MDATQKKLAKTAELTRMVIELEANPRPLTIGDCCCYSQIDGDFWFAEYFEFDVVMMRSTGHINATKLCSDNGKRFAAWLADEQNKDTLEFYAKEGMHIMRVHEGSANVRGTYIPNELMYQVGSWISPRFTIKCNRLVNQAIANGTF